MSELHVPIEASRAGVFADAAADPAVAGLESALPVRLADLVADRARRCRALVEEPPPDD